MKKYCFNIFVWLFVSLFCVPVHAQKNFVSGYIVPMQGDTLQGEIQYENWVKVPKKIIFKNNGVEKQYNALDIKAFGIVGQKEHYEGFVGKVDATIRPIEYNSNIDFLKAENRFRKDTIFLRVLLASKDYRLYIYNANTEKKEFFIKTPDGGIEELLCQKYAIQKQAGMTVISHDEYKILLQQKLSGCPSLSISKTPYREQALVALLKKFLVCKSQTTLYEYDTQKDKTPTLFGVIGGINMNSFRTTETLLSYDYRHTFPLAIQPSVAFFIEKPLARNYQKWSFVTELGIRLLSHKREGVKNTYPNEHKASYAKLSCLGKYKFTGTTKTSLYASGGGCFNVLLKGSSFRVSGTDDGNAWNAYNMGASAALGYQMPRLRIELRGETFVNPFNYINISAKMNTLGLLVAYTFNKPKTNTSKKSK